MKNSYTLTMDSSLPGARPCGLPCISLNIQNLTFCALWQLTRMESQEGQVDMKSLLLNKISRSLSGTSDTGPHSSPLTISPLIAIRDPHHPSVIL